MRSTAIPAGKPWRGALSPAAFQRCSQCLPGNAENCLSGTSALRTCNKPCNPTWKTILRIVTYTGWELKEFLPEGVSEADLAADPKKAGVA